MAVQQITGKRIIKHDTSSPNYKAPPKPEVEEVSGNVKEDIYGEKKHTYQPDNGNLQMNEFMTGVMNKLDGLTVNPDIVKKSRAVEVDIKREIAIGMVDTNTKDIVVIAPIGPTANFIYSDNFLTVLFTDATT